jgi:hypothetical protein
LQITEKFVAELRIESFNVFNIMNLGAPDITFGSPSFGRVSTLAAGKQPRQLQFALKFYF